MKFSLWNKPRNFVEEGIPGLSNNIPRKTKQFPIYKIVITVIIICAIADAILLGIATTKAKTFYQEKQAMALEVNKVFNAIYKTTGKPSQKIQLDVADSNILTRETNAAIKKVNSLSAQNEILKNSLVDIASELHYTEGLEISDFQNSSSVQSKIDTLVASTKKMYDLNESLLSFVATIGTLTNVVFADENELLEKLSNSPKAVYTPILDAVDKNKKDLIALKKEMDLKEKAVDDLRKSIESASANQESLQQMIHQKQSELQQVKAENLSYKTEIKNALDTERQRTEELKVKQEKKTVVERTTYPELYYELKGSVVEYNSKWGFIIINFGSNTILRTSVDGVMRSVIVPPPLNKEVYISRGDKFVAKAKIVKIYSKYTVANVIFPVTEKIVKGDTVFFEQENNVPVKN